MEPQAPEQASAEVRKTIPAVSPVARIELQHVTYRAPGTARGRSFRPWERLAKNGRREDERRHDDAGGGAKSARRLILDDVSFSVEPGRVFTVLGPSGSGKSTLLRTIDRLIEPTSGRILLDGVPTTGVPVQELRRRVGMVFQAAALFDGTVMDNVLYGPRLASGNGRAPDDPRAGWSSDGQAGLAQEQASALLRRVGLPDSFCQKPVDELSGGEAQRVSLARALANDPQVLLLDEPTAALDPSSSQLIEDLLEQLADETDLTFVFVTHNLPQARRIGDHGLLLVDGRVVDSGPLPAFLDDPGSEITRRFVTGTFLEDTP